MCEICKGSGARPGTQASTCPSCRGAGQVRVSQGPFSIAQTCPRCHGSGSVIPNPCSSCQGAGRVKLQKTLSVKIPTGVDEGDRVRLSGEGEPGVNGGPPGDLYVQVHIKPHPVFQRDHDDLHCEMPISISTAALGGEIEIPTLEGHAKVKIPAGVDQDDRIRLSGEGEAGMNGGPPGDLYVVVNLKPHAVFQREGADLHCEMPISFATAALGGEIEIPTLEGHAKVKVPPETQTGQVFRLRNKGIRPVRGSVTGDLYCHVAVETPVKLTSRQKELLREFEEINERDPGAHNPRAKSFMDKVRDFFAP